MAEDTSKGFEKLKETLLNNFCETNRSRYGGAFMTRDGSAIFIKHVKYNPPKVTIIWNDGTTSTASCVGSDKENYTIEAGLNIAINNRLYGYDEMKRLYSDWLPYDYYFHVSDDTSYDVDITDVRKKHRMIAKEQGFNKRQKLKDLIKTRLKSLGFDIEFKEDKES